MIIGIDAITVKSDGGVEHLTQILNNLSKNQDIEKIFVWSNLENLEKINNKKVIKCSNKFIYFNNLTIIFWRLFFFRYYLKKNKCNILLCCSGYFIGFLNLKKILIFQNILPFVSKGFKNKILKTLYKISLNKADGNIFLSQNSKSIILKNIKKQTISKVISHGVDERYFCAENQNQLLLRNKLKLVYISTICDYKNQINLLKALFILKKKGYNIQLDLIGNIDKKFSFFFYQQLKNLNLTKNINLIGHLGKDQLVEILKKNNVTIFPSKFETFGISLLESMASSKLILCSNTSAMPEILGDAGLYFDPDNSDSIAKCIENLFDENFNYTQFTKRAYNKAKNYSWKKCSDETFNFIRFINEKNFNN